MIIKKSPRQKPEGVSEFSPSRNNHLYLYTKGGEFSLHGQSYIGEYHYTGATPKTGPVPAENSEVLRRFYKNHDDYVYDELHNFNVSVLYHKDPKPILYRPVDQAYVVGYDTRYFVEKVQDEHSYAIEIDTDQYNNIGTKGGIDGGLYLSVSVRWKLTGTQQGIINHNKLELYLASEKCPSIDYAIKNYLEFARITLV